MRLLWQIVITVFAVIGFAATYLPLWASYKDVNMWKLPWQIWAMTGFTIFWMSLAIVIWQLYLENRRFHSEDYERKKEKEELEIEKLRREHSPALF